MFTSTPVLRVLLVILVTLGPLSTNVLAEKVKGLYKVTLPVESQSRKHLRKATREGLKTVFVRVSGNRDVLVQHQIAAAVNRAHTFTKQFRYKRLARDDNDKQQLVVVLEFERKQVDKQLRDANLPLWPGNRPSVLVWMVVEDSKNRRFASAGTDPELIQAISDHATRRGLAIKLPLLDLEDNLSVSPDQLWQLNADNALSIARRYHADTVLVGRASRLTNGRWLGAWLYQFDEQRIRFDGDGDAIASYIGTGLDRVADLLAANYAIAPVNIAEGGLLMRVTGIRDFTDYARAINYLESVAAIRYANVIDINGNDIIVRLKADGSLEQLQQSLALDKRLQASGLAPYEGHYTIALHYRWPETNK